MGNEFIGYIFLQERRNQTNHAALFAVHVDELSHVRLLCTICTTKRPHFHR